MKVELREAFVIRRKLSVLDYAQGIGNVRKACLTFEVPRSSFYRWKSRYERDGMEGLIRRGVRAARACTTAVVPVRSRCSATNVLAHHGAEMPQVKYLVGREDPTLPTMYRLEIGHFDEVRNKMLNPFCNPEGYTETSIDVDYSTVGWYQENSEDRGGPYFAAGNGHPKHILHETICPEMWGKRCYSLEVTQALLANGALTLDQWPADLAKPDEAQAWGFPCLEIHRKRVWLAAVAEMMDREQLDLWSANLDQVLFTAPE